MTTTVLEQPQTTITTNSAVSKFDISKSAIDEMVAEYASLVINGVSDSAGLKVVHEARMKCVRVRTSIDKRRKELTEESRKFVADVNDVAKKLTAWLEPTEKRLAELENEVEMEKKRIVLEAEEKLLAASRKRLQDRINLLTECRAMRDPQVLNSMTDEEFAVELKAAQEENAKRVEQEAIAQAEREKRDAEIAAEQQRLAEQRAELDRMKAEAQAIIDEQNRVLEAQRQAQLAEQKKLDDAKAAAEKEERDRLAAIEQERLRKEAVAQALKERDEQIAREKMQEEIAASQREAARLREEGLKPDREKLLAFADQVQGMLIPRVQQTDAMHLIALALMQCSDTIRRIIKENLQ